jgi:translation initiation factor 1
VSSGPFNNPFQKLQARRDALPSAPSSAPAPDAESGTRAGPARAVVRYERKGHGGKEITRVEQLGLSEAELEAWLKPLKHSLGCGGRVDADALVVQGDQRERLPALLRARGVRKVVVS